MRRQLLLWNTDNLLRTKAEPVTEFNQEVRDIVNDLEDTMYHYNGAGLAHVQMFDPAVPFHPKAIFVMSERVEPSVHIIINPKILEVEGEQSAPEGCLSFVDVRGVPVTAPVKRPTSVYLQFQDVDGNERRAVIERPMAARCVVHENEHIQGKLWIDNLSSLWRGIVLRKCSKTIERGNIGKEMRAAAGSKDA